MKINMTKSSIALCLYALMFAQTSYAALHLTLQGSANDSNLGLQEINSRAIAGSLALDLGRYLRIGFTHRQQFSFTSGYSLDSETETYTYSESSNHVVSNSIDLIVILYYGKLFVPYVMAGGVKKVYYIKTSTESESESQMVERPIVPNGGVGLGIRLNQRFSLKISYTFSPGVRQMAPDQEPEAVLDRFLSLGVSYNI